MIKIYVVVDFPKWKKAISYEIINKRSKKSLFDHELDKMWIHGYLHLCGHDHIKYKDFKKMSRKENLIFKQLNF